MEESMIDKRTRDIEKLLGLEKMIPCPCEHCIFQPLYILNPEWAEVNMALNTMTMATAVEIATRLVACIKTDELLAEYMIGKLYKAHHPELFLPVNTAYVAAIGLIQHKDPEFLQHIKEYDDQRRGS
jgi:hypothetical protein